MNGRTSNGSPGTMQSFLNIGTSTNQTPVSGRRRGATLLAVIGLLASTLALIIAGPALAQDGDLFQVTKQVNGGPDCNPVTGFGGTIVEPVGQASDSYEGFVGETISFCVVVLNTTGETISNIVLTDDNATVLDTTDDFVVAMTDSSGNAVTDLPTGQKGYAVYQMVPTVPGSFENSIVATGTDSAGTPYTSEDSAEFDFYDIVVAKTSDVTGSAVEGDDVTFTFSVTNNSAVAALQYQLQSLTDSVLGNVADTTLYPSSTCALPTLISFGATYSCSVTVPMTVPGPLTPADWVNGVGGTHENTVTAAGQSDPNGPVFGGTDMHSFPLVDSEASILVEKTASPTQVMATGEPVTFTFSVTNTSVVDSVEINTMDDSIFGNLDSECGLTDVTTTPMTPTPVTLAPGAVLTCSITEVIMGTPGTQHVNVLTVEGTGDDGEPLIEADDATVDLIGDPGSIEVAKDANPTSVPASGADVTFTFTVFNTSTVDVSITSLTDSIYNNLDGQGTCSASVAAPQVLTPQGTAGDSYTCEITEFISGDPTVDHTNTVTASGEDQFGNPVEESEDEFVDIVEEAVIRVRKRADFNEVPESGEDVTFTFLIDNRSATVDITLTELIDSVYGDISVECNIDDAAGVLTPIVLAPGDLHTCQIVRNVSGQAGTQHKNIVDVTGEDENGNPVTDRARKKIDIIDEPSAISIVKTANPTQVPPTGGNVTFTFVITNDSVADDVTLDSLSDSVFGDITNSCTASPAGVVLAPGASHTCTITEFIAPAAGSGTSSYNPTPPSTGSVGWVKPPHTTPACSGTLWYNHADTRMGVFGGYVLTLPTGMNLAPGTWAVDNFVAWDSDIDRPNYPQFAEVLRIEFLLNGAVVAVSNPTIDLPDYVVTAWFTGGLGTVNLPNGADQVNIVHSNIFAGTSGTNSLDPVSLCMVPIAADVEPHVNVATICVTDDDGVALCDDDDATVTFDGAAGGGITPPGDDGDDDDDDDHHGGHPGGTDCPSGQKVGSNGDCEPDCKRNKRGKCKPTCTKNKKRKGKC